jgi:hypothetical protein
MMTKSIRLDLKSRIPVKYSAIPFAQVSYLMPGLWDCHVHYFGMERMMEEQDEGMPHSFPPQRALGQKYPKIWKDAFS